MYYPQGSYGKKGWGKHGPLRRIRMRSGISSTCGMRGDNRRFAQAFCIYEGGLYPESFEGKVIGPNSLHNVVWVSARAVGYFDLPDGG